MTRIEQEKRIVRKMIELYCRHHLHQDTMPDEYLHLADFACRRLDHCTYGEQKTACKDCPTHCYAPKEREAIREVMRWAGPRMIWYAPKDAFIHFFHIVKHWLQSLSFRTGVIVLLCCIPFYILSFAQMLLPTSVAAKGILWTILFGLAKTCKAKSMKQMRQIMTKFQERNGATQCKLLKGIGTKVVLRECPDCVADAAEFLEEQLNG